MMSAYIYYICPVLFFIRLLVYTNQQLWIADCLFHVCINIIKYILKLRLLLDMFQNYLFYRVYTNKLLKKASKSVTCKRSFSNK